MNDPRTCLIVGADGLLGSAVANTAAARGWDVHSLVRDQILVPDVRSLGDVVVASAPSVVINCAAHTAVDRAEDEIEESFKANALLPGVLAEAAQHSGAVVVQISSTGCYGNWKDQPYTDDDPLRPTTVHHHSKAEGEEAVRRSGGQFLILRTGWLYGGAPGQSRNFVWQRLLEATRMPVLLADTQQRGNPTCVADLAAQIFHLVDHTVTGTFNAVAHGTVSRFEYVERIIKTAGLTCRVEKAPPNHFKRKAPVSANEMAENQRLRHSGFDIMPSWSEALDCYVATLLPELRRIMAQDWNFETGGHAKPRQL